MSQQDAAIYIATLGAMLFTLRYMALVILGQTQTISKQDEHQQGPIELARSALNMMADLKIYIGANTDALKVHEKDADQRSKTQIMILEQNMGKLHHLTQAMPELIEAGIRPVLDAHEVSKNEIVAAVSGVKAQLDAAMEQSKAAHDIASVKLDMILQKVLTASAPIALVMEHPEGGEGKEVSPPEQENTQV